MHNNEYQCPVCGFGGLSEPPYDVAGCASFDICPCCGTEFGYDDASRRHSELRDAWIIKGAPWTSPNVNPPDNWDPKKQLREAGLLLREEEGSG